MTDNELQQALAAVKANPRQPEVWQRLGELLKTQGEFEKAEDCFKRAQALKVNEPSKNIVLPTSSLQESHMKSRAESYYQQGVEYYSKKNYTNAINSLNESLNLYPHYAEAFFYRGLAYQARSYKSKSSTDKERAIADFDQAIVIYNDKITHVPDDYSIYVKRGEVYHFRGNSQQALIDLGKAIQLNPNFVDAYIKRADVYRAKSQYDIAIFDYNDAISLDPNNASLYAERGRLHSYTNNYDQALKDFYQAVRLDPENSDNYEALGFIFLCKEDYDQAFMKYEEAIRLNPRNAFAYQGMARCYQQLGQKCQEIEDFDKGIDNYQKAIKFLKKANDLFDSEDYDILGSEDSSATTFRLSFLYYYRGEKYVEQGYTVEAITDFTKAINLQPDEGLFYYSRGKTYGGIGDYSQAFNDYTKALELTEDTNFRSLIQFHLTQLLQSGVISTVQPKSQKVKEKRKSQATQTDSFISRIFKSLFLL